MKRRPLWNYPLFQIPLICFCILLMTTLLFGFLGVGRPLVNVAIALNLSNSTYENASFNAPGTIMAGQVTAVESYLDQNSSILRRPNQVQVFGFAGVVRGLTSGFKTNGQEVKQELTQSLQNPNLENQIVPGTTDLTRAINAGIEALRGVEKGCREILLVTDGQGAVSPEVIASAIANRIRVNSMVVGAEADALQTTASGTGGIYLTGDINNLQTFFTDRFFNRFNSNLNWIIFWAGLTWIALMWLLVMPIDRWLFQDLLRMPMNLSGRLALSNALFWTTATPFIIWRLAEGLPFLSQC